MTKYLARHGFEITVLTSQASGRGEIKGAVDVVRTRDLLASGLNWRRGSMDVMSTGAPGTYRRPSRLQSLLVPDPAVVTWLPFALASARRLAREHRFDCVITTSPPQTAHLVGAALAKRGLPWIAELRDGWTFEPPRPEWPNAALRSLDRRLERSLRHAVAVVGVTEPIAGDLRDRLGLDAHVITNGFDLEETPAAGSEPLLDATRRSIVYTGRMGVADRRLGPLLEALKQLAQEAPQIAANLEVVFAGPLQEGELTNLSDPGLRELVRVVGNLDRPRTLRLQREAAALLLLTRGARSEATGKLYEYLAAARPILVLGDETAAAQIVTETRTGAVVAGDEPAAIATALSDIATGEPEYAPDAEAVRRYSWPVLADAYTALIESKTGQ
jgi:glycosyltransferase involved in cell wall biosynthesis